MQNQGLSDNMLSFLALVPANAGQKSMHRLSHIEEKKKTKKKNMLSFRGIGFQPRSFPKLQGQILEEERLWGTQKAHPQSVGRKAK